MFQVITDTFNCELNEEARGGFLRKRKSRLNTLGYPKAALFVFCLAIVAFNILSTVKAALKSAHGVGKIEAGLSDYYLVEEIQGTFRGRSDPEGYAERNRFTRPVLVVLSSDE